MIKLKKILIKIVIAAGLLTMSIDIIYPTNIAYAEIIERTVEDVVGEYRMGDHETREQARHAALAEAKRVAAERVFVGVIGNTFVENMAVVKDNVSTYAMAHMEILKQSTSFVGEEGTLCRATITAFVKVDKDKIMAMIEESNNQSQGVSEEQRKREEEHRLAEERRLELEHQRLEEERQRIRAEEERRLREQRREFNGHHYQIVDESLDWYDAEAYCEDQGGHLVSINSEVEQKFIESLLSFQGARNSYWIGGRKTVGGKLYWVDGSPFTYTNWADGQPDNISEMSLMIYRNTNPLSNSTLGQWNDLAANGRFKAETFFGLENFGFICEWDY